MNHNKILSRVVALLQDMPPHECMQWSLRTKDGTISISITPHTSVLNVRLRNSTYTTFFHSIDELCQKYKDE